MNELHTKDHNPMLFYRKSNLWSKLKTRTSSRLTCLWSALLRLSLTHGLSCSASLQAGLLLSKITHLSSHYFSLVPSLQCYLFSILTQNRHWNTLKNSAPSLLPFLPELFVILSYCLSPLVQPHRISVGPAKLSIGPTILRLVPPY